MSISFPLPPTSRDLLVYERITVDCASTREVAAPLGISQTRVRQICKKVLHWLAQTLPAECDLDEAAALRVAQHIAADRLQRFLIEANQLWKHTGETRYMGLCVRILTAQSKIPAFPGTLDALAADAIEGPLPEAFQEDVQGPKAKVQSQGKSPDELRPSTTLDVGPGTLDGSPPPRDCSAKPVSPTSDSRPLSSQPSPSSSPPPLSADRSPTKSAARKAFLSPAHPLTPPGNQSPVTELKITPQELGFSKTPTRSVSEGPAAPTRIVSEGRLSRRERRRLRQKMQSK